MLSHLSIRSLAVIDRLELECASGMTALTGETGAGKSILVDALALLLGARADSGMIRDGAERAEVCGVFEVASNASARAWLADRDLDADADACIVRRVVGPGSRSRSFVNYRPVPAHLVRELGSHFVDIHGQHEHHLLLDRDRQRIIVDDFGDHHALLEQVAQTSRRWHELQRELASIAAADEDRDSRLDFLRFQLDELEGLQLEPEEPERLAGELRRLANAETILEGCRRALDRLDGDHDGSAAAACAAARRDLDPVSRHDARAPGILDLLDAAELNLTEAATSLRAVAESLDLDPERLAEVERRLGTIHDFARKHRVPPRELPAQIDRLRERVASLAASEERATELAREAERTEEAHRALCGKLTAQRREAGNGLAQRVTRNMQELGMPGGRFMVDVRPRDGSAPSPSGADQVELFVSTGPGQSPRPLSKVASGGELSRISLAIQVSCVGGSAVPTLVFDEADVGIGGRVAEIVGRRLRALGESHQILCVTHLAQVASRAHHHAVVRKLLDREGALGVCVAAVSDEDRIQEIARMLGGERITPKTLAHAREMLDGS